MTLEQNFTAFLTITKKEINRFLRIWPQTLLPSAITQSLYFVIFGTFIGSQIRNINGVSYMAFIVPGLVMMAIISNSFSNVVSSFFGSKFQKNIEELLVSPTPNWIIVAGYAAGGTLRGIFVGAIVLLISVFFTKIEVHNIGIVLLFTILTAIVFSLGGMLNGIYAKKFDDVSIFPTFVLTPLTYLGGVFYSIKDLPAAWQQVSRLNPVLYMIDGFRYGFYGFSDINIGYSLAILVSFTVILSVLNWKLLKDGTGLRS